MAGKFTWKLLLIGAVLLFAVSNLVPLRDTEFETYFLERATSGPELTALVEEARQRQAASDGEKSFFVALREAANEGDIDVSAFFPDADLEDSLVNITKRNNILLEHLLQASRGKIKLGLDLRGGVSVILEVDETAAAAAAAAREAAADDETAAAPTTSREEELERAIQIIRDRIDAFGVAEPIIRPVGENRIEIQLAGVSARENPDLINLIQKPARLEFSLVYMEGTPDNTPQDQVPPIYRPMTLEDERGGQPFTENLYVKLVPEMTGDGVDYARAQYNQYGSPEIALQFTDEGAERFAEITREIEQENMRNRRGEGNYGRLAIILDGKLYSAPSVREEIRGGNAVIYGSFTAREAQELADVLNNPLDIPLRVASMSEVGPSLARDSIDSGQRAFLYAVVITALFMAVYYTMGGIIAVISMAFNIVVVVGVMASIGATMSMPGIAGLVLTLGMAVDSNILIFERMREELASGKNLRASLEAGFEKAFSAILDANVTTLITATIMMSLGTGPVKGFGVVLTIGIFSTMFAALLVSRVLLELLVHTSILRRLKFFSIVPSTAIDFMRFSRPAFISSWTVVLIGAIMVFVKGDDIYGIDFVGGDEMTLTFDERVEVAEVRAAAQLAGVHDVLPVYTTPIGAAEEQLRLQTPFDQGDVVLAKLQELHPDANFELIGENRIGASVSSEIKWNAFLAIGLSLVGILLYVALRFEMGYGVGAVVATVHDLFMTIGVFVVLGRQFNAAMVGAVLLVVGYSINDTIVVFDRIREELALNPNMRLRDVINHSLNRTLQRTVVTGATTFGAALMLFLLTGGAVNDLALTLIIGLIVGTFSSIFIASPVFFWWHKGDRKHVEASHDITPKYEWSASSRAAQ